MRPVLALVAGLSLSVCGAGAWAATPADKLIAADSAYAEYEVDTALRLYNEVLGEAGADAKTKASALFGRAEVYAGSNRFPLAIEDYTAALAVQPDPAQRATILFSRAEGYARTNQVELALADYAESLRLAPDQLGVHTVRGNLLQRLGRKDEALVEFEAELARRPNNYRARVGRAVILGLPLPPDPEEGRRSR